MTGMNARDDRNGRSQRKKVDLIMRVIARSDVRRACGAEGATEGAKGIWMTGLLQKLPGTSRTARNAK